MLVVLVGDPLACCLAAVSLVGRGLQVVVFEDLVLEKRRKWATGPLPWCVTNVRPLRKDEFLCEASFHQARSSVMFLESVQRSYSPRRRVEMPVMEQVSIKPSPGVSGLVIYHPVQLEKFVKQILRHHKDCFFAIRSENVSVHETLKKQFDVVGPPTVVINLANCQSHRSLPVFNLSQVDWIGLNSWKLPDSALLLPRPPKAKILRNHKDFTVVVDSMNYDVGGVVKVVDCVNEIVNRVLLEAQRVSKL